MSEAAAATDKNYYTAGNSELATETPLTLNRLEPRRKLTRTSDRLVIALVGLPARGKSFVARKMSHYLNWTGVECKIFNVGRYRREAYAQLQKERETQEALSQRAEMGACDADFFSASNEQASQLRERVAEVALRDMLGWLDDMDDEDLDSSVPDMSRHSTASTINSTNPRLDYKVRQRIAIYDATNSTNKRRNWILEECTSPEKRQGKRTGVIFVESLCDDEELLDENYRYKVSSSPDFKGMPQEQALADLRERVRNYEKQYETITDDNQSYIKVFNLSTKILVNHIYGRMAKDLVPAVMAWHIGTRPVFLCRPGETLHWVHTDGEDYVSRDKVDVSDPTYSSLSTKQKKKSLRGDTLGPSGETFKQELLDYVYDEAQSFMFKRASVRDLSFTGTSISGLYSPQFRGESERSGIIRNDSHDGLNMMGDGEKRKDPFPLRILTSTMPRAADTVHWEDYEFTVDQLSSLNPLDKGDFAGMELEEIREKHPGWYEKLQKDPFRTRFIGGECYEDLVRRLTNVVIDLEQQVQPTLLVSHVSILQCLIAYFRNTPVEKCMSIEVPMHTVIKFTPVRGGGWSESKHAFTEPELVKSSMPPVESMSEMSALSTHDDIGPIWGDYATRSPANASLRKIVSPSGESLRKMPSSMF